MPFMFRMFSTYFGAIVLFYVPYSKSIPYWKHQTLKPINLLLIFFWLKIYVESFVYIL